MKIENQVVSLELAKKLKKAGYSQDSIWFWEKPLAPRKKYRVCPINYHDMMPECDYAAPTVAELGEKLIFDSEEYAHTFNVSYSIQSGWYIYNSEEPKIIDHADTEANARAKMWLYLKEKGLIK